ncbi:MAG: hypothetical protein LKF99_05150 [Bifidobacterium sp.]|nr:hypothetical protein [Bifidobacterium sp.]
MAASIIGTQTAQAAGPTQDDTSISSMLDGMLSPPDAPAGIASGPSEDRQEIAQAAGQYDADDLPSAVGLADAACAETRVPLEYNNDESLDDPNQPSAHTDAGQVAVSDSGTLTATNPDGLRVSINPGGAHNDSQIVDGSLVDTDVAPSTSIVTSATHDGIQSVAVLADSRAPNTIPFPYQLPEGATLEPQQDGSIAVKGPVANEVASQEETERYNNAVQAIVGDATDPSQLSDEHIDALASIPAEAASPVTEMQTVATIPAPWATDANGNPVPTHCEANGSTITQVIETKTDTASPVTANPS